MKGLDFKCPIDKSAMEYVSLYDGYENNNGYQCLKCNFLYEMRSSASIKEQARDYKQEILTEYRSLTSQGRERRIQRFSQELNREAREKMSELERKVAILRA